MTDTELFNEIQKYIDKISARGDACFSSMLKPKLLSVKASPLSVVMSFTPEQWMVNTSGIVHGGITASYADLVMGTLAKFLRGGTLSPTVDMHVSYHHPVSAGSNITVRTKCISAGRTVSSFSAEIFTQDMPEKILVSATGLYYTKAEKK